MTWGMKAHKWLLKPGRQPSVDGARDNTCPLCQGSSLSWTPSTSTQMDVGIVMEVVLGKEAAHGFDFGHL